MKSNNQLLFKILSMVLVLLFLVVHTVQIKVKYVGGVSYLQKPNGKKVKVVFNMDVNEGDTIITEDRSFVALVLSDKSVHKVTANTVYKISRLRETDTARDQKFNLKKGKVFNYISKSIKNTKIRFVTPSIILGVRGTLFSLEEKNGKATVYLLEGGVSVDNQITGQNEILVPNQKAVSTPAGTQKSEMTPSDAKSATQGVPVQVGSVTIKNEADVAEAAEEERTTEDLKRELSEAVSEENNRVAEQTSQNQELQGWDYEFDKQIGSYTVKQYYEKRNASTVVLDTYTTSGSDEYLMGLRLSFDGRVPTLEDRQNNVVREVNQSTLTIRGTVANQTDTLVYDNDSVANKKAVNLNGVVDNSPTVTDFDVSANGQTLAHAFPKKLEFTIDGVDQTFDFGINFVDDSNTAIYAIGDLDQAHNQILSGDLSTRITVTPSGTFNGAFTSGGTFNVFMLNDFLAVMVQ